MVEHVAVYVTDFERAKQFYSRVLELFGYRIVYEEPDAVAYFADRHGLDFGIGRRDPAGGAHVAFGCPDRETVDRFYETAIAEGARDNGPPGIRTQYDQNYYAGYVLDSDGNNLEAVCHAPPP